MPPPMCYGKIVLKKVPDEIAVTDGKIWL